MFGGTQYQIARELLRNTHNYDQNSMVSNALSPKVLMHKYTVSKYLSAVVQYTQNAFNFHFLRLFAAKNALRGATR